MRTKTILIPLSRDHVGQGQCQKPQLQGKNQDQSLPVHPTVHTMASKSPKVPSSTGKYLGLQEATVDRDRVDREAFLLEIGWMVYILGI